MQFIKIWIQSIIISVIISTIIEMLLPNNSNGKYVKMIIGVFILFTIISPVISKVKGNDSNIIDVNVNQYIKERTGDVIETSSISINNKNTIKNIYAENLKIDIKSKVSQKGYIIDEVNLEILDNNEYSLNKIEFKVVSKNNNTDNDRNHRNVNNTTTIVENIENIKISLGGSRKDEEKQQEVSIINESEKRKLKQYLSSVYEVNENNISIR